MKERFKLIVNDYCLRFEDELPPVVFKKYWRYLRLSITLVTVLIILVLFKTLNVLYFIPLTIFYGLGVCLGGLAIVALTMALTPYLKLKKHFEELEKEGLWLAALVRFYSISGFSPLSLFDLFIRVPFNAIKREAKAFLRLSIMYGFDRVKALTVELSKVPKGVWYRFLRYVESTFIHGQDPTTTANSLYSEVEAKFKAYLERKRVEFNTLAVGSASLFTLLPLSMLTIATIVASSSSVYIAVITTLVNMIIAIAVIFSATRVFNEGPLFHRRYVKCIPLLFIPVAMFMLPNLIGSYLCYPRLNFLSLITSTILSLTILDRVLIPQSRMVDEMYEHVPLFLNDLTVHMSQGKDILSATRDVLKATKYSESFNIIVSLLMSLFSSSTDEVIKEFESRMPRSIFATFYFCFQAARSGNIAAMSMIVATLRDYCDIILGVKERLKVLRLVFLVAVIMSLGITIYLLNSVVPLLIELSTSIKTTNTNVQLPIDIITAKDFPSLKELITVSLFINSVIGALVIGTVSSLRLIGGVRFAILVSTIVSITLLLGVT